MRNNRVKKISSEPDAVIKRATPGSRAIGSRPLIYAIPNVLQHEQPDMVESHQLHSHSDYEANNVQQS